MAQPANQSAVPTPHRRSQAGNVAISIGLSVHHGDAQVGAGWFKGHLGGFLLYTTRGAVPVVVRPCLGAVDFSFGGQIPGYVQARAGRCVGAVALCATGYDAG